MSRSAIVQTQPRSAGSAANLVIRGNPGTRLRIPVRQPLAWTAAAAFVGATLGLAGVIRVAAWFGDDSYGAVGPPPTLAFFAASLGELLVAA
jgi:hypothetical protein